MQPPESIPAIAGHPVPAGRWPQLRPWHSPHWPWLSHHPLTETLVILGLLLLGTFTPLVPSACTAPDIPLQPATGFPATYGTTVVQAWEVRPSTGPASVLKLYTDGMLVIEGVPWFHQGQDRTCAQANIATLLNFWGVPLSYPTVVEQMNPGNFPTDVGAIRTYLRQKGLRVQDYRGATVNFLRQQINAGRPTLVLLDFGDLASTHYVTVKGYDKGGTRLLLNDPVAGANTVMPVGEFERRWQAASLAQVPGFGDRYTRVAFVVDVP